MNLRILLPILITWSCLGQPSTNSGVLASFDVNNDGRSEGMFILNANRVEEWTETWEVDLGLRPQGSSRILEASDDRIAFNAGELISPTSATHLTAYLGFLSYTATFGPGSNWAYYSRSGAKFDSVDEFILGYRFGLADGWHMGWLKFQRPTVNQYTPFALAGFDFHPVPNQAIVAGESAPIPPIEAHVSEGSLVLSWDARWGPLGLECSPSPVGRQWKPLDGTFVGGTTLGLQEEKMFVRLRRP